MAGRPLIEWSLIALDAAGSIEAIVVAVPPGLEADAARIVAGSTTATAVEVVAGGPSRAESVRLTMEAVGSDLVAIHDAARPLITAELTDRLVGRLADSGIDGVIAAAPVADTLKREGDRSEAVETVDRSGLWGAQTPQVFVAGALRSAQSSAVEAGVLDEATDEAWLLERVGGTVLLEATGGPNPKVTDAADLAVAAALLASPPSGESNQLG